jgi:uncharacterized protein YoxC
MSNVTDQLVTRFLIPSIVVTLLFLVIYIAHIVRRRKLENAIFEIRDTLREMQSEKRDRISLTQK